MMGNGGKKPMSGQFRRVRDLFDQALEVEPAQRPRWLREACGGDAALEREVSALLEASAQGGFLLDQPILSSLPGGSLLPSGRFGPYEILEEIGHGGMGTVYRAVRSDDSFRKIVAIKVIEGGFRRALAVRFQRERQILAKLEHPNIARILDGGTEQGVPYLVMEFVEGETLDRYCESRNLSIERRLALVEQLCQAVDYAHRNLIVHRDIKPGNVLVTAEGMVKLLDFGIAKMLDLEGEVFLTQTLQLTPDYASPEQIRGELVTPSSDVYSLGVLLFELLTRGSRPRRTGASYAELIQLASREDVPAPSSKAPAQWQAAIRGDLDAIVCTALAASSERRYATAGRLGDDLRRLREGRPVWARGDSAAYRTRKFVRRHWAVLAGVAAVILALLGGIVATARQARIARLEKEAADRARLGERQQLERAEKALAETQAARADAQRQAEEATRQRGFAEKRYQDVRSLATTVLFDIYDQIKGLAGASEARRVAASKALQYLDSLSRDAADDPGLQAELAAAYERSGDILGNIADSAVEGAQSSLPLYQKALALRKRLPDRIALAHAYELVGVSCLGLGRSAEAVENFETAMRLGGDRPIIRATLLDRLATAYGVGANFEAAVRHSTEAVALFSSLPDAPASLRVRAMRAHGMLLRYRGRNAEAAQWMKQAAALLGPLMEEHPDDLNLQRSYASMLPILAQACEDAGQFAEAKRVWNEAKSRLTRLAALSSVDPQIVLSLAYGHKRAAWRHYYGNLLGLDPDDGEGDMAQALEYSRRLANREKAGAAELIDYADTLLRAPYPELRNATLGLRFARRGNEMSSFRNPMMLDTLAWAYYRSGDRQKAVETMERAIELLPVGTAGGLRTEYEAGLREFQSPGK